MYFHIYSCEPNCPSPNLRNFGPNVGGLSTCNTNTYKICKIIKVIFSRILKRLPTKQCNYTNFKMLFLVVLIDFARFDSIKIDL